MKVVLAHGVFDLLHPGHIEHLQQARAFGDSLFVSVVPDRFAQKGRSLVYNEHERLFMLRSLRFVDDAILCRGPGPEYLLEALRPDIYVRGSEYAAQDRPEYALVKELGIEVGFTKPIPLHTTNLLTRITCSPHEWHSMEDGRVCSRCNALDYSILL